MHEPERLTPGVYYFHHRDTEFTENAQRLKKK
jgi:hypothetical protein